MSEVGLSAVTDSVANRTSSMTSGDRRASLSESGKTLPPEAVTSAVVSQGVQQGASGEGVNEAVAELNAYVQNEQRDLMFSVDEGSGDTVVRVIDRSSGDLIRQIPNEVVLDMAAKARDNEPLHLISMHG